MFLQNYLGDPTGKNAEICSKCSANVTVGVEDKTTNVDLSASTRLTGIVIIWAAFAC